jgi:uncharacterized protein (DUF427 family)
MSQDHPIQTQECSKPLQVIIAGQTLASTRRAIMLIERNYPIRHYIPREDVDMTQLRVSSTQTFCPHKGQATYYSAAYLQDVAWSYELPLTERSDITDALCFADESWLHWPDGPPELNEI